MAEGKDAELAKALEGNAALREQLAEAQAAIAQVHFVAAKFLCDGAGRYSQSTQNADLVSGWRLTHIGVEASASSMQAQTWHAGMYWIAERMHNQEVGMICGGRCVQAEQKEGEVGSGAAEGGYLAEEPPLWPPAAAAMTSSFSANLGMMARRSANLHVSLTPPQT